MQQILHFPERPTLQFENGNQLKAYMLHLCKGQAALLPLPVSIIIALGNSHLTICAPYNSSNYGIWMHWRLCLWDCASNQLLMQHDLNARSQAAQAVPIQLVLGNRNKLGSLWSGSIRPLVQYSNTIKFSRNILNGSFSFSWSGECFVFWESWRASHLRIYILHTTNNWNK